jgi:hypothetical protein
LAQGKDPAFEKQQTKQKERAAYTINELIEEYIQIITRMENTNMINQVQVLADIGLRAQSNSRKALATLAEIKNPRRATFIKQLNHAVNQQINEGCSNKKIKNNSNPSIKLEKEISIETLDTGSALEAIQTNQTTETLQFLNRTSHS